MPFSFDNRVGRLVEVSLEGNLTAEEAQQFRTRMFLTLGGIAGRAVLVGDMRRCGVFVADVGDKMVTMLKQDSPKVERSAFILSTGALAAQVDRIVSEAAREAAAAGKPVPPRRAFRDAHAACAWLSEVLTGDERKRLAELFASA